MITKCPRCGVDLVLGKAIDPGHSGCCRYIVPTKHTIEAKDVKLIDCLKCPKCGFSDDGR